MLQTTLTALLVTGCAVYAAWTLLPQALRHALAGAGLRLRLPGAMARRLRAVPATRGACGGCTACASGRKVASGPAAPNAPAACSAGTPQPLVFHPSRPSRVQPKP